MSHVRTRFQFSDEPEKRMYVISLSALCAMSTEAPELLQKIKADIEAAKPGALPGGALEGACEYALGIRQRLTCFLQYPELDLSTNLAENSMRPIVLGRKNWIHIGSKQAGPRVAAILSVVESCRRLKVPVRDYLADILPGLANTSIQRVANLTPEAWIARHNPANL